MFKRTVLSISLALTWFSASASNYYVVVPSLPSGLAGQPYPEFDFKSLLSVTGDPDYTGYGLKWSLISGSLPAGLTLNNTGKLSGTPSEGGTSSFQLQASYKTKSGQQAYRIVVAAVTISLTPGTAPLAMVGKAYTYDLKPLLSVSGDSNLDGTGVTWEVVSSTLPAGLSLRADGTIAGTPTAAGDGSVTVRASYKGANGLQTYQVVSLDVKVSLAAAQPPKALLGQMYSYDLKPLLSVSGDPSYAADKVTWTYLSNSLPAGLVLSNQGIIAGTPTVASTGNIVARATYNGLVAEQTYAVTGAVDSLSVVTGVKGPLGADGSTQLVNMNRDDHSVAVGLPFSMKWFGAQHSVAYVGSNSYITFRASSTEYRNLSLTSLGLPGIMFGAADHSYQRVYSSNGSLNGVPFTRIRYEGDGGTYGMVGRPGIVTEITFYAPQETRQIVELVVGQHNGTGGVFGVINSVVEGTVNGGNISPNMSYVFESDATGSNWTITSGVHVE